MNALALLGAGVGFALGFVYASLFEYVYHRWMLHRRYRPFREAYRTHSLLHHQVFGGDTTYHVQHEGDRDLILFQWWQGPLLVAVHAPALWGLQVITGLPVLASGLAALAVYFVLYESLHWCMHNPAGRWIERRSAFQYLDAHHRLHHGRWRVNFNVVLPIADLIFSTFARATPVTEMGSSASCRVANGPPPP
jgi:hypothetical protein